MGFPAPPTLHMAFTATPARQDDVALRIAGILHRLGYPAKAHLVSVTRDIWWPVHRPHGAQDQRDSESRDGGRAVHRRAYYLSARERKGLRQEAIEILLQVMENQREDSP